MVGHKSRLQPGAHPDKAAPIVGLPSCHKLDRSSVPFHGPPLYGLIGRARASAPGFDHYSPAMRQLGGVWSEEALNVFLAHPAAAVPGTTMVTDGLADPRERADLIAYLRTLGDGPPPGSP